MQMLRMCLDWKVLIGLAVIGVGSYVVAPGLADAALPILLLAICPLSMLIMMKAMQRYERHDVQQTREAGPDPTRENRLARLRTEQANLVEQMMRWSRASPGRRRPGERGPGAQERRPRASRRGQDLEQ